MHMRVIGVSVDGGDNSGFGEIFFQMLADHFLCFLVVNFTVERINHPVVCSALAVASVRACQLIFFRLPGELS